MFIKSRDAGVTSSPAQRLRRSRGHQRKPDIVINGHILAASIAVAIHDETQLFNSLNTFDLQHDTKFRSTTRRRQGPACRPIRQSGVQKFVQRFLDLYLHERGSATAVAVSDASILTCLYLGGAT